MELFKTAEKIFSSRPLTKRLQRLLAHQQSPNDLAYDEDDLLEIATDLFKRKKFVEAAKSYRSLLEVSKSSDIKSKAANNLCQLLYKKKRLREALVYAEMKIRMSPRNFKGYYWLSLIYSKLEPDESQFQDEDVEMMRRTNQMIATKYKKIAIYFHANENNHRVASYFTTIRCSQEVETSEVVEVNNDEDLRFQLSNPNSYLNILLLTNVSYELPDNLIFLNSCLVGIGEKQVQLNLLSEAVKIIPSTMFGNMEFNLEGTLIQVSNCHRKFPVVFFQSKIIGFTKKVRDWDDHLDKAKEKLEHLKRNKAKFNQEDFASKCEAVAQQICEDTNVCDRGPPIVCSNGSLVLLQCIVCSPFAGGPLSSGEAILGRVLSELILYIVDCDIANCEEAAVEVRDGGTLICYKSRLHHNKKGALIWRNAKRVEMIGCEVYNNKKEGILVETGDLEYKNNTSVRLIDNKVHGNGYLGISCGCIESILIQGNEVFDNVSVGIFVRNPRQTMIRNNDIHHNESGGIQVRMAEFQNTFIIQNKIHHNNGPAIDQFVLADNSEPGALAKYRSNFSCPIYTLENFCFNNL